MKGKKDSLFPRKALWLAVVVLGLLGGVWAVAYELQPDSDTWVRVQRRDLVIGVDVEGQLEAVESALLGPPQISKMWNFKIAWMGPEGEEVSEGQPVLRFDTSQLQQQLLSKQAARDSAAKNLEKKTNDVKIERRRLDLEMAEAEAALRRADLKLQVPDNVASRNELETARIDKHLAELQIESLRSKLRHQQERSEADVKALRQRFERTEAWVRQLQEDIESMTVKAPRSGTLIYVTDWRGNKVKVSETVWRARNVVQIPNLERMKAEGEIAEADIGRLAPGQVVTLYMDAHPDHRYSGKVHSIRRSVQRKSRRNAKKIVKLEIELEETDTKRMRPGMRFRGRVEIERVEGALVVPAGAVFSGNEGSAVYVKTLTGKREVSPSFGARNQQEFGVVDGLEEGDLVLLRGTDKAEGAS